MKTFIAVPCMESVPSYFAQSLAMLKKRGDCTLSLNIGSLVYDSRNKLAMEAIQSQSDYVMWFDSDMLFSPDVMVEMMDELEAEKLDILSGIYFRRVKPYTPVIFEHLKINKDGSCYHRNFENDYPKDTLFEVDGIGFGGVIMRTSVLIDVFAEFGTFFNPLNGIGEDLSFCWRARKLGYKIHCDSRIKFGHCGHYVINEEFYQSFYSANQK